MAYDHSTREAEKRAHVYDDLVHCEYCGESLEPAEAAAYDPTDGHCYWCKEEEPENG